jgi:hypothetical protein
MIVGYKKGKKETVKTHMDSYLGFLWGGSGIAMAIALVCMTFEGIKTSYFCLMLIYGVATFVSGGLLKFKPLIYGSLFSFLFAIISIFSSDLNQLLCISGALLFSYIIPGHLLRAKYKSQHNV